ncbi:MAG: site-2 protease family protein, partial [Bacteroidales bacterium]|nr:site-2 protease family protein [Bacteroidales bacterium]
MKILALILSLSFLVFIHELGHFLFARLFKTRVE